MGFADRFAKRPAACSLDTEAADSEKYPMMKGRSGFVVEQARPAQESRQTLIHPRRPLQRLKKPVPGLVAQCEVTLVGQDLAGTLYRCLRNVVTYRGTERRSRITDQRNVARPQPEVESFAFNRWHGFASP